MATRKRPRRRSAAPAADSDIQRKTFLPYREEAVDKVMPMEVHADGWLQPSPSAS